MQNNSLKGFIIKIFIWLPICYWCWYYSAEYMVLAIVFLTDLILKFSFPDIFRDIEQIGNQLEIIVKVTLPAEEIPKGMLAEIAVPVNPLLYSYGLPLCITLILSSPAPLLKTFVNCLLSVFLLLPVQIWGICFDFMKTLFLQTPSHLLENLVIQQWQLESIAIGYQIGTLVLPVLTPIIIWIFLYKNFIVQFIPVLQPIDTIKHN